ncbi:MAG: LTA synthase family protein [Bacillota bacterium]
MLTQIKKTLALFTFLFLSILVLEVTFRIGILHIFMTQSFYRLILLVFVYAFIGTAVLKFFGRKGLVYALPILITLMTAYYVSQSLYNIVVDGFYSVNMLMDAGAGAGFSSDILGAVRIWQVIYLIPLLSIAYLVYKNRLLKGSDYDLFDAHYYSYRAPLYMIVAGAAMFVVAVSTIPNSDSEDNIAEDDIFDDLLSTHLAVDRFGLMTYAYRDVANAFREPVGLTDEDENARDFLNERPTHSGDNEMSDIFEGKNLIFITAESLDTLALHPEIMPNYFEMLDNSYNFDKFYAPLYYRTTADTEFMQFTSFFPNQNVRLSMEKYKDNHFPNTLPRLFGEEGYESYAFHNYSDHYYPRNDFHPDTIGFDHFSDAEDMGLWDEDYEGSQHPWPSDDDMMKETMDDYVDEDQFFTYYLTVSGHLPYSDKHDIAEENLDEVTEIMEDNDMDTDIDEEMLYYYAANYEFDQALGTMIDKLKDEGVYEDTVIVVASDHYAYGLDDSMIEEYDTEKDLDETDLNMHNVPMMIHNPEIEGENNVEDIMSTIDMTPTLSNMFGLPIDYHQILGYDAFEDYGSTVSFQDLSILREGYHLEVERDLEISITDGALTEEDVMRDFNHYTKRRQTSRYILETDFLDRLD